MAKKKKFLDKDDWKCNLFDADGKEVEVLREALLSNADVMSQDVSEVGPESEILSWVRVDYEQSGLSLTDIAGRYGVPVDVIENMALTYDWERSVPEGASFQVEQMSRGVMVPEGVELDMEQLAVIESIDLIDKMLSGYSHLIDDWSRTCVDVRARLKEMNRTGRGDANLKEVGVNPYKYGHKDMKDFTKSVLDLSFGRLKLMERLPQSQGAEDIESKIAAFAARIQRRELTTFQRDSMPDVVYVERTRAALEEIANSRDGKAVKEALKAGSEDIEKIVDEGKSGGMVV